MRTIGSVAAVLLSGYLLTGCGGSLPSADTPAEPATPALSTAAPPASSASAAPSASASGREITLADIFPAAPERDLVLNTCNSCHAVACVARGRRTAARWANIKAGHTDSVSTVDPEDLDKMFKYVQDNFNDIKPEPAIPPSLLEQGCSPY